MRILNAGRPIAGALGFEIQTSSHYAADTFSVEFAFNAAPRGLAWWGDEAWDQSNPLVVEVQASLDGGITYTSLLTGRCDHMTVYLEKGLLRVEGRDLASLMIDAKAVSIPAHNQTSSQIVTSIAEAAGLIADVTATSTLVGRFDGIDRTVVAPINFSRASTQWDLVCLLAQREQYDVWVSGNTLHFHPQSASSQDPFLVVFDRQTPHSNVLTLSAERSLSFTKDITVIVKSFNSREGRSYSAHSGQSNASSTNTFNYILPNLEQAGCQAAANRIRAQLSQHEHLLAFEIPGELSLTPRTPVRVIGTNSGWDEVGYRVDSVSRSMSFEGGFTQRVQCKSISVPS